MANRFCTSCGAPLKEGMKLCPSCGKLVKQRNQSAPRVPVRSSAQRPISQPRRPAFPQQQRPQARPPQRPAAQPRPQPLRREDARYGKSSAKTRAKAVIFSVIAVLILLGAVYFAIFTVQVVRVKSAEYNFRTEMKMTSSNYGEAIGAYFKKGKWSVDPIGGTCTYKGETKHSEEWEIVFSTKSDISVEKLIVDGKEMSGSQIETKMMAMFI